VQVPFAIRKRGGRKLVLVPAGTDPVQARPRVVNAMIKALARAFRWRKLLEAGDCGSIDQIAAKEKINLSYVGQLLRMTLLAPEIVEAILDGRQPTEMTLVVLMQQFPVNWAEQIMPTDATRSTTISGPSVKAISAAVEPVARGVSAINCDHDAVDVV
jgi:hypothetical protein